MRRIVRCLAAVALTAAAVTAMQQPAAAVAQVVMSGGGSMTSASGPGLTTAAVTGTISGTAVVVPFGICTFSNNFFGNESLLAGNGGGQMGCFSLCAFTYQRVGTMLRMQGNCPGLFQFEAGGFVEPNSVLPTTSYLFQVTGVTFPGGTITIQGNMAFSPAAILGTDLGTPLPTSTGLTFSGTMTGVFDGFVGSCSFTFTGGGNEGWLFGDASMSGVCTGPFFSFGCGINWAHVGTHAFLTGSCSGPPAGFSLFGTGELVMTAGGNFTFAGELTIL